MIHDAIHQADAIRLVRIDEAARQQDLVGNPETDDAGKGPRRTAVAAGKADLDNAALNLAPAEAIRMSAASARANPAPAAGPFTAAITGLVMVLKDVTAAAHFPAR